MFLVLVVYKIFDVLYPDFAAVLSLSVSPLRLPLLKGTGRGEKRNTSDCLGPDRPPHGALTPPVPSRSMTSRTSIMKLRPSLDCHLLGRGGFTQHSLRTTLPLSTQQM